MVLDVEMLAMAPGVAAALSQYAKYNFPLFQLRPDPLMLVRMSHTLPEA
jgi:hypothetical protein